MRVLDVIDGLSTVAASQIEVQDLPLAKTKRLPNYALPVLQLARLATHEDLHGTGVGSVLLR